MSDKKLIIADGHHRYETSVGYMHDRAQQLGIEPRPSNAQLTDSFADMSSRPEERSSAVVRLASANASTETGVAELARPGAQGTSLPQPPFPEAAMMMTFVNMDAPGITILPTHRVVFGLPQFNGRQFAAQAERLFTVEEIPSTPDGHFPGEHTLLQRLNAAPGVAFVAATREGDYLLTPRPEALQQFLAGLSPRQQQLDVVQLHKLALEQLLHLNEDTVRAGNHVRYVREAHDALQQVGCGNADIAFLIKPVTLEQMKNISLNLEVMPQKSTDFYPKLLSGLAMYALDRLKPA